MRTFCRTAAAVGALGLVLGLGLGACSSESELPDQGSEETTSSAPHNAADVAFATGMIPHHAQALQMVDMADDVDDLSPDFEELIEGIEDTQEREIAEMSGWLQDWGEDLPPTSGPHAHMGDMGEMMSQSDLDELMGMRGTGFEDMWLTMMIQHHRGAIAMARTEQAEGEYPPALDLARSIETSQRAEIDRMQEMRG